MNGWLNKLHQLFIAIAPSTENPDQWRLIIALGILVIGLFLFEIVFRTVRRRIQASLKDKGRDLAAWNISAVLPAARLAATAWLLRLAESLAVVAETVEQTPARGGSAAAGAGGDHRHLLAGRQAE